VHKLQRGAAPVCLVHYRHGRDNWSAVTHDDKLGIWRELEVMQGGRCAYCEGEIGDGNRHIEHFRQKGRDAAVTFLWSNLFGSCNREDSCGKHKDSCGAYNLGNLLKPDMDDADDYFIFVSDGSIAPRADLDAARKQRAEETLRIFNLAAQHGALRQRRRAAVLGHLKTVEDISELAELDPHNETQWQQWLECELQATAHLPFATAIRHALIG
jgi:uncharacterized protein (TIGR02646 family)